MLLADVYLKHLKDRRNYAFCYEDLVSAKPSVENYKSLGEAYLKIQEPEEALRAFEEARNLSPKDEDLILLYGNTLVQQHNYSKALQFYEMMMSQYPKNISFRLDLAKFCLQQGKLMRAEELLNPAIFFDEYGRSSADSLAFGVQGYLLLFTLHRKNEREGDAMEVIEKAERIQKDLISLSKTEGREGLANIYIEAAKYCQHLKKTEEAISYYEKASKMSIDNQNILYLLACIHGESGNLTQAENLCQQILKLNKLHLEAGILLSELLCEREDLEQAEETFVNLYNLNQNNFTVLCRLLDYYSRIGKSIKGKEILDSVSKVVSRGDSGLSLAKGVYARLCRKSEEALKELNLARRSPQYREIALFYMIETFVNPEMEPLLIVAEDNAVKTVDPQNLKAAESLLKDLSKSSSSPLIPVLLSHMNILNKTKGGIDTALNILSDKVSNKTDFVPGILALAIARFLSKKANEGQTLLKMIVKMKWCYKYAECFEHAWLLYAELNMSKPQVVEEYLKKTLKYNKSSAKAYELLGILQEKDNQQEEAMKCYKYAWKLTNENSPSIGFRYSFLLLKSRDYVECLEICKRIFDQYPDNPKLEKEVASKARWSLRNLPVV